MRSMNLEQLPRLDSAPMLTHFPKPRVLEIGCGVGLHPILYAKRHADRCVIAIESTHERYAKFENRLARHRNLTNVFSVHADARIWVSQNIAPASLERVFILYPNPYPKKRHSNLRWHSMPFTQTLIDALEPGGVLEFSTNVREYAQASLDTFTKDFGLGFESIFVPAQIPSLLKGDTHFERKYLESKQPCYRFCLKKI
ncbi:hypothetical protein GW915_11655 [bacterium]|nr:hypothetical protein [bacterium]